jgi:uncharacterized membrane protein
VRKVTGVLLLIVGALLILWGGFSVVTTLIGLFSVSSSAYSLGYFLGRGLVGAILLLLGWKAFQSGRRRMSGNATTVTS